MLQKSHTIAVIDSHPVIHTAIDKLLRSESGLDLAGAAGSSSEAMMLLEHQQPDLVLVELSLDGLTGTHLVERMRSSYPGLKILVYSLSEEKLYAERAADAGADGYVMKTAASPVLVEAIRTVLAGDLYFPAAILRYIQHRPGGRHAKPLSLIDFLSRRESIIFKLIGQGVDEETISALLKISPNTVSTHRINIKNKLNLPSGKVLERLAYELIQHGSTPQDREELSMSIS
jgi:DNA-binding NarL/FixJ family response regulator